MQVALAVCQGLDFIGFEDVMESGGYADQHYDILEKYFEKAKEFAEPIAIPLGDLSQVVGTGQYPAVDPDGMAFDFGNMLEALDAPSWQELLNIAQDSTVAVLAEDGDMTGMSHFEALLNENEIEAIYDDAAVICSYYERENGSVAIFRSNGFYINETHVITARHNVFSQLAFVGSKTNLHPVNYEKFDDIERQIYGLHDKYTLSKLYIYKQQSRHTFCEKKLKNARVNIETDIKRCEMDNDMDTKRRQQRLDYWLNKHFMGDIAVIKTRPKYFGSKLEYNRGSAACGDKASVLMVAGVSPKFQSPFYFEDGTRAESNELDKYFHSNSLIGSITDEFSYENNELVVSYNAVSHAGFSGSMVGVICGKKFRVIGVHSKRSRRSNHAVHINHPFWQQIFAEMKSKPTQN